MIDIPDKVFEEVIGRVNNSLKKFMADLWQKWSHLNVEETARIRNFKQLDNLLEEYYDQISEETNHKFIILQEQINALEKETNDLRRSLNVDISYVTYEPDSPLWQYKELLESHIVDYRKQLAQRKATINMLREWQHDLCKSLGIRAEEIPLDPLPTEEDLVKFRQELELLQSEKDNRIKIFLERQSQIKEIMAQLGKKPKHKFEQLVCHSMSIDFLMDSENLAKLEQLYKEYNEQLEETKERFVKLREKLNQLWECLDVELQYRSEFLSNHTGCTVATEDAITAEIARLQEIKRENIKIVVEKVRLEIQKMWDLCMSSEEDRDSFMYMKWDTFNEDVLEMHELYYAKLKALYEENTKIFDLLKNRTEMWAKMKELEEAANKPGRYNNRGGQLLQEEKQRKTIAAKLPKIESDLLELAQQFEQKNGKPFTIKGTLLTECIKKDWDDWRQQQALKMSARKANATPVSSVHSRAGVTPQTAPRAGASMAVSKCNSIRPAMRAPSTAPRPITSATKRRAAAVDAGVQRSSRRRLDLNAGKENTTSAIPKITVNGSTLKTKLRHSKRLNRSKRLSNECKKENDTTFMTSYTDFKVHLHENTSSRSSVVPELLTKIKKELPDRFESFATPTAKPRRQLRQHTELVITPSPRSNLKRRSKSANSIHRNKDLPIIF